MPNLSVVKTIFPPSSNHLALISMFKHEGRISAHKLYNGAQTCGISFLIIPFSSCWVNNILHYVWGVGWGGMKGDSGNRGSKAYKSTIIVSFRTSDFQVRMSQGWQLDHRRPYVIRFRNYLNRILRRQSNIRVPWQFIHNSAIIWGMHTVNNNLQWYNALTCAYPN